MNARGAARAGRLALALLAPGAVAAPILEAPGRPGDEPGPATIAGRLPEYLVIESIVVGAGAGPASGGPYAAVPSDLLQVGYRDLLPEAGSPLVLSVDLLSGVDAASLRRRMGLDPASEPPDSAVRPGGPALWIVVVGLALALGVYFLQYRRRRRYARAARARRHIPIVGKRARSRRRRARAATRELHDSAADARRRHGASRSTGKDGGEKRRRSSKRSRSGRPRHSASRSGSSRGSSGRH
ncbi:hypothetical protein [Pseudohaliea sp.]|uniref:hypothetical protein n=1 Tax=Pseudohaliea sp. TaxID=2740289 RepID=UPI0032EE36DF